MRWTAVVNPTAGRGRTRRLLPRLAAAFEARDIEMYVSSDAEDGRRAARKAFTDAAGVIACGGDGTVAAIAAEATEMDGVLAVMPTGAGNDFARHLGISSRRPFDALSLLTEGRLGLTDLGRARAADGTTAVFTTVANTGFDAEANRWANGVRWITGTSLYVCALLRTIAVYRPQPLQLTVDGVEWVGEAWLTAVGNTRFYAGGMMITPGAEADDGCLDVCVVEGVSRTELLRRFPRVFKGTHTAVAGVHTFRGKTIELGSDGATVPMELWASGDRVGPLPATLEVWPSALRVLVPAQSTVRVARDPSGPLS